MIPIFSKCTSFGSSQYKKNSLGFASLVPSHCTIIPIFEQARKAQTAAKKFPSDHDDNYYADVDKIISLASNLLSPESLEHGLVT